MKTKNIVHSKVKNAGILFETLIRQITVDTLEGRKDSPASNIMAKYFRQSTELGKEVQLYRAFFEMGRLTEIKASQFIDLILSQYRKLDENKLLKEKYELVKEIKRYYNTNDFLSVKIPAYKVYASIFKTLMAESNHFNVSNVTDIALSRFTLIEHLTQDKKKDSKSEAAIIEEYRKQDEDMRLLTYKVLLERFNEKYANLNDKQKMLLREYINSVSNSDAFAKYVHSEIEPLMEQIAKLISKEPSKVQQVKLREVVSQLDRIKTLPRLKDNHLTAMMIAYQIVSELQT